MCVRWSATAASTSRSTPWAAATRQPAGGCSRPSALRAAWAWLRTPLIHPLSLIQPNISVSGIHLLHLQKREDLMIPALQEIYRGLEAGHWRPVLDRTFGLDRAGAVEAHTYIHARKNLGKVVLVSSKVG
jgi:hypothetical protein